MSDSWVGGDISGLTAMGTALKGAKKELNGVVRPLSRGVEGLVHDAGWKGDAAKSFRAQWSVDAITAGGFADLVEAVGETLADLATALSTANSALQNAADVATRKGVPVGPKGVPGTLMTNNPPSAEEKTAMGDLDDYATLYKKLMHEAQRARIDAAKRLDKLYASIDPDEPMAKGDKIVVGDYLRGLWTAKTDGERALHLDAAKELPEARREHDAALKALEGEEAKFKTAEKNLPKTFKLHGEWRAASDRLDSLERSLARAENGSAHLPYDRQLNYKLADALEGSRLVKGAPDFLKEIPVIDVAATVAVGALEAKQDHDKGWSWKHSALVDVGGGLVGLGAGVGAAALATASLPADAVVATAAVGGAVVVGVSTFADKLFHEHWSEDIHDHGVFAGTLYGIGHSEVQAWDAGKDMVSGSAHWVGDKSKKLWHGVSSIF
ncbi:hypothetical protein ACFU99_15045 [Streptomyces sp. NPDC057654]|uniref:WXG100 family type VII secretion target n=1 Tax=Streptomyces sp. NPDC057654 TaxID=3346196 RepID=UPI003698E39D